MMIEERKQAGRGPRSRQNAGCCAPVAAARPRDVGPEVARLAALGDPTRLQIVEILAGLDEPLCVCEIVAQFALGQPTISHHLRVLREAGLVTWEKRGQWVYYALNRPVLGQVAAYLDGLREGAPEHAALRLA